MFSLQHVLKWALISVIFIGLFERQGIAKGLTVGFTWNMEERYGLDRNGNKIIDIPNSKEYVQNTEMCPGFSEPRFRVEIEPWVHLKGVDKGTCIFDIISNSVEMVQFTGQTTPTWRNDLSRFEIAPSTGSRSLGNDLSLKGFKVYPPLPPSEGLPFPGGGAVIKIPPDLPGIDPPIPTLPVGVPEYPDIPEQDHLQYACRGVGGITVCRSEEAAKARSMCSAMAGLSQSVQEMQVNVSVELSSPILGENVIVRNTKKPFTVCLPEGTINVKVSGVFEHLRSQIEEKIEVDDIIVAVMGDSYASGEGNPDFIEETDLLVSEEEVERVAKLYNYKKSEVWSLFDKFKYRNALWADDGKAAMIIENKQYNLTLPFIYNDTEGGQILKEETFLVGTKNPVMSYDMSTASPVLEEHHVMHRSSLAASSQFALMLEKSDPHTSVTYINLAMTGSETKHILDSYYNTVLDIFGDEHSTRALSPLDNLLELASNRKIDVLLISAGGNDIGFSYIIEACLARETWPKGGWGPTLEQIKKGYLTGEWAEVENDVSFLQGTLKWSTISGGGLNKLSNAYSDLINGMKLKLLQHGKIGTILITEYPTPLENSQGKVCDNILAEIHKGPIGFIERRLEIDGAEITMIKDHVLPTLNQKALEFAELASSGSMPWEKVRFVSGIYNVSKSHGLCEPEPSKYESKVYTLITTEDNGAMRWFRGMEESHRIQGPRNIYGPYDFEIQTSKGIAHPNQWGHKGIMKQILKCYMKDDCN